VRIVAVARARNLDVVALQTGGPSLDRRKQPPAQSGPLPGGIDRERDHPGERPGALHVPGGVGGDEARGRPVRLGDQHGPARVTGPRGELRMGLLGVLGVAELGE